MKKNTLTRLNKFAKHIKIKTNLTLGYPVNENTNLDKFYKWHYQSKLYNTFLNNAGDPKQKCPFALNSYEFENEVIKFFAPLYGFSTTETWGLITSSGCQLLI